MDKIERVDRVLSGEPVDRPPVTLWYHFGVQHGGGRRFARLALDFFDHYDLDVLKVMNDYFYPMPEGLAGVRTREDLIRVEPFDVERSDWKEQLRAVAIIARELKGRAYFVDTVFDPWNTMRRSLAGEHLERLMEEEPDALQGALGVIAGNLVAYSRRSLEAGAAGIFLAIPAGREIVSRENFLKFVKPFALQVLGAISGLAAMNTAHIHGDDLSYFDDCLNFPAAILNWWDRGSGGPTLPSVKERIEGCVMGGIDHRILNRRTPAFIKEHVREGRRQGGRDRFLLAGGCSIDSSVNPRAVRAVVAAAREPL